MVHDFSCGTRALDFAGTLRARRYEEPFEFLVTPADLDAWFVESGLVPGEIASTDEDFIAAIELREAIYELVWSRLHARSLPRDAIDVANAHAAHPPLRPVLDPRGWTALGDPAQALSQVAREAIEIIGGDETDLLRECARPECTQIYLDRSHGRRREWCSMAACGSRMKAKAYRERKKAAGLVPEPLPRRRTPKGP